DGYEMWQNRVGAWQVFKETDPDWPWSDGLRHMVECIRRGVRPSVTPEHSLQVAGIAGSLGAVYLFNVGEGQAGEVFSPWLVYAVAPIFLWGSAALLQKLSTDDISAELSTCWFLGAFVPIAAVILATRPIRWSLPAGAWLLVTSLGALYGL